MYLLYCILFMARLLHLENVAAKNINEHNFLFNNWILCLEQVGVTWPLPTWFLFIKMNKQESVLIICSLFIT